MANSGVCFFKTFHVLVMRKWNYVFNDVLSISNFSIFGMTNIQNSLNSYSMIKMFPFGVWAVELQLNITIFVRIRNKHNHNNTKQQHTTISGRLHADFSLGCCFPVHLVFILNMYDTPLCTSLFGKPFVLFIVKSRYYTKHFPWMVYKIESVIF